VRDLLRQRRGEGDVVAREQQAAWQAEAQRMFAAGCRELAGLMDEVTRILGGKELTFHRALAPLPDLHVEGSLDLADTRTGHRLQAMEACIAGNWGKEKPVKDLLADCLKRLQLAYWQVRSIPLTEALFGLTGQVDSAFARRKERRGALDFDDLQIKCRDLLARDATIRDDYRQRCRVLMVDEFQDTNPLQKELVDLLCGPEQRLFVVGDPKQSIYLFRGADVGVFIQTIREITAGGGRTLFFQESFRSRQGIIRFVNSLFSQVMGGSGADFDPAYGEGDILEPQRVDGDNTPCVELLDGTTEGDADTRRRREAIAIARRIGEMVNGSSGINVYDRRQEEFIPRRPGYGDIAILFRRFSNLKLFERELRRADIPYYVVKGRGFYRCQEVLDILNFFTFLEYGKDLAALTGVLRSPLCGVSDETLYWLARCDGGLANWQQVMTHNSELKTQNSFSDRVSPEDRQRLRSLAALVNRLRPLRDRLTLAELLEEILTGSDFASILLSTFQGVQKVANLRKLIELARSFNRPGEGSLRRFVNHLTGLVEQEPTEAEAVIAAEGEDVVRLMTIHQSKGLEFPIVFVPELGAGQPGNHSPVRYDADLGLGVRPALPGGIWCPTLAHRAIADRRKAKESAELKRLLYVAVTRARDHLVLSGEGKGEWRCWLDAFLDSPDGGLVTTVQMGAPLAARASSVPLPPASEGKFSPDTVSLAASRALHYTPARPSAMVFSPTALEDYAHCPRKYYYKAVLGLDEGLFAQLLAPHRRQQPEKRHGMSALEQGNLAHAILERLDFAADPDGLQRQCRQLATFMAPAEPAAAEVVEQVLSLATSPLGRKLSTARLLREHPFTLHLRGAADYYIRGAMDLVAVHDDRVTVYDYKYMTREGADLEGYRFQLSTYLVALERAFPGWRTEAQLLFLKGGGTERVECDLVTFEKQLLVIMDAIRERSGEGDFGLLAGCDGSHCPFRQRCGMAR